MHLIDQLESTKNQTLLCFSLSSDELHKRYAADKWTIKQILVHLADAEAVLMERIKRIIAEPHQVLYAFQQDLWNVELAYDSFPLELSRDLYIASRNINMFLVSGYYTTHAHKEFIHSETGIRTLGMEMEKVALHNAHHLAQIEIALKNIT